MKQLLVVYFSRSGGARSMADAVLEGARDPTIEGVSVLARSPFEAGADDVLAADALILGTPENFGYMSGAMKHFLEEVYYPCLEHTQGLPYALFVKAGNDGSGAVSSIGRIVTGLRWREVLPPLVVAGDLTPGHLEACRELGMTVAAGLEAGLF